MFVIGNFFNKQADESRKNHQWKVKPNYENIAVSIDLLAQP